MAERPILFSGPMVRAILEGRKTQTRRLVKVQDAVEPDPDDESIANWVHDHRAPHPCDYACTGPHGEWRMCPYGEPGDLLWVRETFRFPACLDGHPPAEAERRSRESYDKPWCPTEFVADGQRVNADVMVGSPTWGGWGKTRPGIHMPRWASRITLRVTSVRVERLQSITDADARAEGVMPHLESLALPMHHVVAFAGLWDEINGARASWESNPWVWVVGFEREEVHRG